MPAGEIARQFGDVFAAKLGVLPSGRWQGPVESAFGVHLVFVSERKEGRMPALTDVRDAVRREWDEARRAGNERSRLPGDAQALHRDRRNPGADDGNSRHCEAAMKRALLLLVLVVTLAPGVSAHEIRPGYLELRQTGPETYDALWKVPGQGEDLRLGIYVELPASCTNVTEPRRAMVNAAFTERWTVKCAGGLTGGTIHIAGLSATVIDVLVRLERLDGSSQVTRLTPSTPSFVVAAPAGALGVARTYTVLGVEHILSGVDHLLFVLALIIITSGGWKLVKTVTAFTVSHSITLTLATLGYVHVPQRPVEAVIALSIVFVASEIVHARAGRHGLTARAPWVVALTFGLMHGLGFASGLSDAGLPDGHIPTALLVLQSRSGSGPFPVHRLRLRTRLPGHPIAPALTLESSTLSRSSADSPLCHRERGDVLGHSADCRLLKPRRKGRFVKHVQATAIRSRIRQGT